MANSDTNVLWHIINHPFNINIIPGNFAIVRMSLANAVVPVAAFAVDFDGDVHVVSISPFTEKANEKF